MKSILLFTLILLAATWCSWASEDEDPGIVAPSASVPAIEEEYDYEDVSEGRSLFDAPRRRFNKTIKVRVPSKTEVDLKKLKDTLEKQEERRNTKLYVKIIAGVIVVFVIGGIVVCYKIMCKKKQPSVIINAEETVPALPPESYPYQLNAYPSPQAPYPPQPGSYPPQAPYPPQPGPFPPQQTPYPPQQAPYPPQQAPYPPQQAPYPLQQAPYPPQQAPYPSSSAPYQTEQAPYPPQEASHPSAPAASTTTTC